MEKLQSTLMVHKKADGADTRLVMMRGPFLHSPLECWLGVLQQGTYQRAQGDPQWAFKPVADLWPGKEIDSDLEEEDPSEEEADEQRGNRTGTQVQADPQSDQGALSWWHERI